MESTIGAKRKWLIGCNIRKHEKINIVGYKCREIIVDTADTG